MDDDFSLMWRIDAWDSLAGRAFLCRRLRDGTADPQLDCSAIFVAPPYFQPEPLASRAPGLAATRATFQAGLFVGDGDEVGFASLEDAIAFIRRGYNSHGSEPFPGAPVTRGEGPIDFGGPGLALELPELPRTQGYRQLDEAIAGLISDFVEAVGDVEPGEPAKHVGWNLGAPGLLQNAREALYLAGQWLMLAMLERFPIDGTPDDYVVWASPARSLGIQLVRLGLWFDLRAHVGVRLRKTLRPDQFAKMSALALPADQLAKDNHHILDFLFLHPYWLRWDLERLSEAGVYQELASFPLPASIAPRYQVGQTSKGDKAPTVLTLMSAWFGSPRADHDVMPIDRAMLLFGGACVVVGPLLRENPAYRPWWIEQNAGLQQAFALRLGRDIWAWIAKQLPDRAFHYELEALLRTIPNLWSLTAQAKAAEPAEPNFIAYLKPDEVAVLVEQLGDVITDLEEDVIYRAHDDSSKVADEDDAETAAKSSRAPARS